MATATATRPRTTPKTLPVHKAHAPRTTRRATCANAKPRPASADAWHAPIAPTHTVSDGSVWEWLRTLDIDHDVDQMVNHDAVRRAQAGDDAARTEVVRLHLRLVYRLALVYDGRGVDLWDLLQEGCMGLLHALDKYEPDRGSLFSSYASWWIRAAISRALNAYRSSIRLPEHVATVANQVMRLSLGGLLTDAEIAAAVGLDERELPVLRATRSVASLDNAMPWGHDDGAEEMTLLDVYDASRTATASPGATTETMALADIGRADTARVLADYLSEREAQVIALRFGLGTHDGRTFNLEEAGRMLGVSRERIRQIEVRALGKLRGAMSQAEWRELLLQQTA